MTAGQRLVILISPLLVFRSIGEHLAADTGIAALMAFRGFLHQKNTGPLISGSSRCHSSGPAKSYHHYIILAIPGDRIGISIICIGPGSLRRSGRGFCLSLGGSLG